LASAATVAASSFEMTVTDPDELISKVDLERWNSLRGLGHPSTSGQRKHSQDSVLYVEPNSAAISLPTSAVPTQTIETPNSSSITNVTDPAHENIILTGKVLRLGDYVDTDAVCRTVIPVEFKSVLIDFSF
jgi:hypothetical protein